MCHNIDEKCIGIGSHNGSSNNVYAYLKRQRIPNWIDLYVIVIATIFPSFFMFFLYFFSYTLTIVNRISEKESDCASFEYTLDE